MVVKLTKEQNYYLEKSKSYYGNDAFKRLTLKKFLSRSLHELSFQDLTFLYEFTLEEIMNILLGNYEVKKEGIDIVSEEFLRFKNKSSKTEREIGYLIGIQFAVRNLGFKIKKIRGIGNES